MIIFRIGEGVLNGTLDAEVMRMICCFFNGEEFRIECESEEVAKRVMVRAEYYFKQIQGKFEEFGVIPDDSNEGS